MIEQRNTEVRRTQIVPEIVARPAQSYLGIAALCRRDELGAKVPALLGELLEWFGRHGVAHFGPQLVRYRVVDYSTGNVRIEVGFPVETTLRPATAPIRQGELPAGRYLTAMHQGSYDSLVDTTAALLDWGRASQVKLAVEDRDKITQWGCRVERYLVSPPNELRPERWRTEVAILLSDAEEFVTRRRCDAGCCWRRRVLRGGAPPPRKFTR